MRRQNFKNIKRINIIHTILEDIHFTINMDSYCLGIDLLTPDAEIVTSYILAYNDLYEEYRNIRKDEEIISMFTTLYNEIKNNLKIYILSLHEQAENKPKNIENFVYNYGNELVKLYNSLDSYPLRV